MWKEILGIMILGAYPSSSFVNVQNNLQFTFRGETSLYESGGDQVLEALRSLIDYHEDNWKGIATSFAVSNDVAAGIRLRKTSSEYNSIVKIKLDLEKADVTMSEIFEWENKMKTREISLGNAGTDIDAVDGSYSFDTSLPDLPSDLIGTQKLIQFGIEHCIATSDDSRIRVFALYGIDQFLARIVVCEETRDVGQPKENIRQESVMEDEDPSNIRKKLYPEQINLKKLTSGICWLGDMITRTPDPLKEFKGLENGNNPISPLNSFGKWSLGVQKVSHQWKVGSEDLIQKEIKIGKPMGIGLPDEMTTSISAALCADETSNDDLPKDKQMIYLDWMAGEQVGIMLKNIAMQLPRYLDFETFGGKTRRTFFTEVYVYQTESDGIIDVTDATASSDINFVCSVIARAYSSDGKLKQGSTGFFSLNRA